jgi:3'-phosphoadenosine 5'-phosphosulfate sulfotransferase (PAPS reductase)/FAD synthetase
MSNRHQPGDLKQLQSLPLEAKIRMTQERIRVWYESWWRFKVENLETGKFRYETFDMRDKFEPPLKENEFSIEGHDGSVYLSFSGGKDSTVLKHIVDQMYDDVPAVFVNTGLEYPEIQRFVKDIKAGKYPCFSSNVEIIRPEMRFDDVVRKYGYPVASKEVANAVHGAKYGRGSGKWKTTRLQRLRGELLDKEGRKSMFNCEKWGFLLDAPFEVSDQCCSVMKKKPAKTYEKQTGRRPIIGTLADESRLRRQQWIKHGCNSFDGNKARSAPLSFWTEQDVLHYLKKYNVPYCSVYGDIQVKPYSEDISDGQMNIIDYLGCYEPEDTLETTGCDRTGCIFCMFGCNLEKEPNRFQRLKETHPKQYRYCIEGGEMVDGKLQPNKEGLGLGKVLDYIGVKYD